MRIRDAPKTGEYVPERDPVGRIIAFAEELEDEARDHLTDEGLSEHQRGFYRAQKSTAKRLRRFAGQCQEEYREHIRKWGPT